MLSFGGMFHILFGILSLPVSYIIRYVVNATGRDHKGYRYPNGVCWQQVPVSWFNPERETQFEECMDFYFGAVFRHMRTIVGWHCNNTCHRGPILIAKAAKKLGSEMSGPELVAAVAKMRDVDCEGYCDLCFTSWASSHVFFGLLAMNQ